MIKMSRFFTPYLLILLLIFIFCFPATAAISTGSATPKEIIVVSDDNYPPYIFRDKNGSLQGILVDEWRLWEEKTGIRVDLNGMDWDKAQKLMAEGNAHVIDTIFFTEERAKKLAFTAPYASIDVPVYFHKDISGIKDVKSLFGFTIAVKAGDACIDFLKKNGISTLQEFPSYESIIRSAMEQKVKVFCIDAPPALYYLNKMNIAKDYRHTDPLYTGQFHRAVQIEKKDLLSTIESGFAGISQKEYEEINKRWLGAPIPVTHYLAYVFYLMGGFVLLGGILLLWNYTLRRKVTRKTLQLKESIDALQKSEEKYRLVVENADEAILIAQDGFLKYVNPTTLKILGYSEDLLTSRPFIEIIHPEDREKLFEAHSRRMRGEETQPVLQFRVIAQDGTFRLAASHAIMISWEGKPATLNYLTDITDRKKADEERQKGFESLRKALGATIQAIAVTVETRDPYTAGHQRRVADLSRAIANEMGLESDQTEGIRMAGVIHDLGKIAIPAEILSKPSKLSKIEYKLIQNHSKAGYDILKDIEFPWPVARIVLQHHERIDGSGYPGGLKGEEILIEARIIAVADVVEAIASYRPYRPGLGMEKAIGEITLNKGVLYDPNVVDACLRLFYEKKYKMID
ncbi:MAG: transporter substrate-binding domain-containing protein [Desulfobacterales bacterium]